MPIPPCEHPHCLVDGKCRLTGRGQEHELQLCQTSVPWRVQWIKEKRIAGRKTVSIPLDKLATVAPKPCAGCRERKKVVEKALPSIGPRVSSWLDWIGRMFFGITSWHPVDGKWSVVVTTSPLTQRKTNKYLGQRGTLPLCLRSLEEAGFTKEQITVYGEPRSIVPTGYNGVIRKERLGLLTNLTHGIAQSIKEQDPDIILVVEDDMIYQPDLLQWLRDNPWPASANLITLFKMSGYEGPDPVLGRKTWKAADTLLEEESIPNWRKVVHGGRPWGSGALVLPRPTAEHWLEHPSGKGTPDLVLGSWIHRVGGEYWQASPSRVQHLAPEAAAMWPRSTWQSGANRNFRAAELSFELPVYVTAKMERENNPRNIPIYLISFNRYQWLRDMAKECERFSDNIIIVDNQSTWEPLVEWLHSCPYEVIHAPENYGKKVVWRLELPHDNYYVVSDPDLDLSGVPSDLLPLLQHGLYQHPDYHSCGLSLCIDDIPPDQRVRVLAGERRFWDQKIGRSFFHAAIDTTFAMYRLGDRPTYGGRKALRTAPPYTARHLPWYLTKDSMTEEDLFYYDKGCTWGGAAYAHFIKNRLLGETDAGTQTQREGDVLDSGWVH